jgi:hypothetical protein
MVGTGFAPIPAGDGAGSLADQARRRLQRVCASSTGRGISSSNSRRVRSPSSSFTSSERSLTVADAVALERLRQSLDDISGGRRSRSGSRPGG